MKNPAIFEKERASSYDDFITTWVPNYQFLINLLPKLLGKAIPSHKDQLLVTGFGTGNEVKAIADLQPGWKITGVDPSSDMVHIAQEKLRAYPNIELKEGLVEDLPEHPQFDAASLLLVLHFLPDDGTKLNLLKAIANRLKPGALFLMADIFGTPEELQQNLRVLRHLLVGKLEEAALEERMETLPQRIQYISETRLTELLKLAGFTAPIRFFQSTIFGAWIIYKS